MSLTNAAHDRFWRSMGERFGKRWLDDYGAKPSTAWKAVLDKFSPAIIVAALEALKERRESERAHPPTLAEFEAILEREGKKRASNSADLVRGYWRSVIVATVMRHAALLRIVPWGTTELAKLPDECREVVARRAGELLGEAVEAERKVAPQRPPGIEQHVNSELWQTLKLYRRDLDPVPTSTPVAEIA